MSDASHAAPGGYWHPGMAGSRCGPFPRRGLEIAAIVLGFIFVWPAALAYLAWKIMGYPVPKRMTQFVEENFDRPFAAAARWGNCGSGRGNGGGHRNRGGWGRPDGTGNLAFDDYRAAELKRLEEERRRLDDEARQFSEFVEELKRAKDREEFDAFMKARRMPTNPDTPAAN